MVGVPRIVSIQLEVITVLALLGPLQMPVIAIVLVSHFGNVLYICIYGIAGEFN